MTHPAESLNPVDPRIHTDFLMLTVEASLNVPRGTVTMPATELSAGEKEAIAFMNAADESASPLGSAPKSRIFVSVGMTPAPVLVSPRHFPGRL
jgi:hypothetical protein